MKNMEVKFSLPNGQRYDNKSGNILILLPELLNDNLNRINNYYTNLKLIDFDLDDIIRKVKIISNSSELTVAYDLKEQAFILVKEFEISKPEKTK